MDKQTLKDIQYLLIQYMTYIEDIWGNAWRDNKFLEMTTKYGFTKENIVIGFEDMFL